MTAVRDLARRVLDADERATPGPWEVGYWLTAGVMSDRFGEGLCAFCKSCGDPVWVGQEDINGTRMLAHRHRSGVTDGHTIAGPNGTVIAGNFDYEEGGIVDPNDAPFIALCREAAPALARAFLRAEEALERAEVGLENARKFLDELPHFDAEDTSLWHYHREAVISGCNLVLGIVRAALRAGRENT